MRKFIIQLKLLCLVPSFCGTFINVTLAQELREDTVTAVEADCETREGVKVTAEELSETIGNTLLALRGGKQTTNVPSLAAVKIPDRVRVITEPDLLKTYRNTEARPTVFGYNFNGVNITDAKERGYYYPEMDRAVPMTDFIRNYLVDIVFPAYEERFNIKVVDSTKEKVFDFLININAVKGLGSRGAAGVSMGKSMPSWLGIDVDGIKYAEGSSWFNQDQPYRNLQYIGYHEFEHLLGLVHTFNNTRGGEKTKFKNPQDDSVMHTLMSYDDRFPSNPDLPTLPTPLSVQALEYIYGPNLAFNAGDTVHKLDGSRVVGALIDRTGNNILSGEGFKGNGIVDFWNNYKFREVFLPWNSFDHHWQFFNDHCRIRLKKEFWGDKPDKGGTVVGGTKVWIAADSNIQTAIGCETPTLLEGDVDSTLISGSKTHSTRFVPGSGNTLIKKFNPETDQLDVGQFSRSQYDMVDTGSNSTQVVLPSGQVITFEGITPQRLQDNNFCRGMGNSDCKPLAMTAGANANASMILLGLPAIASALVITVGAIIIYKIVQYIRHKGEHKLPVADLESGEGKDKDKGNGNGNGNGKDIELQQVKANAEDLSLD